MVRVDPHPHYEHLTVHEASDTPGWDGHLGASPYLQQPIMNKILEMDSNWES